MSLFVQEEERIAAKLDNLNGKDFRGFEGKNDGVWHKIVNLKMQNSGNLFPKCFGRLSYPSTETHTAALI